MELIIIIALVLLLLVTLWFALGERRAANQLAQKLEAIEYETGNLEGAKRTLKRRIDELLDERDGTDRQRSDKDYHPDYEPARSHRAPRPNIERDKKAYDNMAHGDWDNYGPGGMPH